MRFSVPEVLLLDIDGVVCEPQQVISQEMMEAINATKRDVCFVTGNTYTRAVDLCRNTKIFCNNADELRYNGRLVWIDQLTAPLPPLDITEIHANNDAFEWRGPRFVNLCPVGRFATKQERDECDKTWREPFIEKMRAKYPDIECVIGGQVSVDIYSKGADKSRAGKWLNDNGMTFTFIGDKTEPGGNDYPLVQYCKDHPENRYFTSTGPAKTLRILERL